MAEIMGFLELGLIEVTEGVILVLEIIGVMLVVWSAAKGLKNYFFKEPHTKMMLGEDLSMALTFLMCGEILRTVIARELKQIVVVCGIIFMRVALTLLIHWEIKSEKEGL